MIHSRRAALASAATWCAAAAGPDFASAAMDRWKGGLPADLDPLDRPVVLPPHRDGLRRFCVLISEQIGAAVELDDLPLQTIGVTASNTVRPPAASTPAGWMLWHCVLSCPAPQLIFVVHRDAAGRTKRVELTSTFELPKKRGAALPYQSRFVGALPPFLESADTAAADRAAQALARFGAEAEDALPALRRYQARNDLPEAYRLRGRAALDAVRAAVFRQREAAEARR